MDARRLAAAVTFSAFFAVFALALLGFAVVGYVVDQPVADQAVQRFLDQHLPRMDTEGLRAARGAAGLIALVSLPVIGLMWVDALRSAIRAVWRIAEYPGRFPVRWAMNLLALVGLALLLVASLAVAFGAEMLLGQLISGVGQANGAPSRWLLAAARFILGLAVNVLLSIAVLTILPRLRMSLRRVLPAALLVTAGLELLTSLGRQLMARAEANPAFQLVAGAVGLLMFLLILNQLILFAAALTATGTSGRVKDLAAGDPQPPSHRRKQGTLVAMKARFDLPLDVAAPKAARDTLDPVLRSWGFREPDWLDQAKVIASELVTNAIRHGGGCLFLDLQANGDLVTIGAADGSATVPRRRDAEGGGRGLALIEALALRWGVHDHEDGKRVWAQLPPPPERTGPGAMPRSAVADRRE